MKRLIFSTLLIGFALTCFANPTGFSSSRHAIEAAPKVLNESIHEGSKLRTYIVVIPNEPSTKEIPIVVLLHGLGGTARGILDYSGMQAICQKDGFAIVAPQGLGRVPGWNCGWINLGGVDGSNQPIDDVQFISDCLHAAEKKFRFDPKRVFVCGHSNGGFMTYVVGSKLSKEIAAIGVVAGSIGLDPNYPATEKETQSAKFLGIQVPTHFSKVEAPKYAVSAIIFHGEKDPTVAYDHDPSAFLTSNYSAMDSAKIWAKYIGITSESKSLGSIPWLAKQNSNVTYTEWEGANHRAVLLVSILTGTHSWPGTNNAPTSSEGNLIASEMIWKFFMRHPKS